MALPMIRELDASPVEHEGETYVGLHDATGIVEGAVVLSPMAFFVAQTLDGVNDVADIQYLFSKHSGGLVLPDEEIRKVVAYLDEHGFLHTDRFRTLQREAIAAFGARETREARMAGKAYPDDAEKLRAHLGTFFLGDEGPGRLPESNAADGQVRCLIVPHIDFDRGGPCYAHGYLRMAQGRRPDTVLVFGVAHFAPAVPFILTKKHFDTPFGVVETDRDLVAQLAAACSWNPFEYEIVHRNEHSLEFQVVMLAYLYGPSVKIVPVLTGSFSNETRPGPPGAPKEVAAFLEACRTIVARQDRVVSVIAGADLAHVGTRFGDDFDIDDAVIARVRARDTEDLAHVTTPDAEAWYRSVMKDQNARRVCGLNCIYAALKSVDGAAAHGQLLHYGYAPDPAGGMVSFASVALS